MASGYTSSGSEVFDTKYVRRELFQRGQLWAWGRNDLLQLGTKTSGSYSSPVLLGSSGTATNFSGGRDWVGTPGSFAAGNQNGSAIRPDGTLWAWGRNYVGEVGLAYNLTFVYSLPTITSSLDTPYAQQFYRFIAKGPRHSAAIKNSGLMFAWGKNTNYPIGDGTTTARSSPIVIGNFVGSTGQWISVACGYAHTVALRYNGQAYAWGLNSSGQCGNNTTTIVTSLNSTKIIINGGLSYKQVACSGNSTFLLTTGGALWCVGDNQYGQLGDNSITSKSSPVQTVAGGTDWKSLQFGGSGGGYMAAIKTDGTLWVWGRNDQGQLGTNDTTNYSSPVQTVAGGTNWKQVSLGFATVGAIKTNGTLWTWGNNTYGQLGQGDTSARSSPTQVGTKTNWSLVATGYQSHMYAMNYIV
jgi:alpha-tubulin suppressor-like RCC1 family protein